MSCFLKHSQLSFVSLFLHIGAPTILMYVQGNSNYILQQPVIRWVHLTFSFRLVQWFTALSQHQLYHVAVNLMEWSFVLALMSPPLWDYHYLRSQCWLAHSRITWVSSKRRNIQGNWDRNKKTRICSVFKYQSYLILTVWEKMSCMPNTTKKQHQETIQAD